MFRRTCAKFKHNKKVVICNSSFVVGCHNHVLQLCTDKTSLVTNKLPLNNVLNYRNFSTLRQNTRYTSISTDIFNRQLYSRNNVTFKNLAGQRYVNINNIRKYSSSLDVSQKDLKLNSDDDIDVEVLAEITNLINAQDKSDLYLNSSLWKSISESAPVEYMKDGLVAIHSYTGLPWWASIILTTILLRTMTSPVYIYQQYIYAKVENLQHEFKEITKKLAIESQYAVRYLKWSESFATKHYTMALRQEWKDLVIRENCHPLKGSIVILLQIPIWVAFSFALRNMCFMLPVPDLLSYSIYTDFATGGFGPFLDLRQRDHSLLLPIIFGLTNMLTLETQNVMKKRESSKIKQYILYFYRGIIICSVPLAAITPSCMALFWTTNSIFTFCQHLVMMSPKARRLVGIPKTDTELQDPYTELRKRLKDKLHLGRRTGFPTKL